MATSANRKHPAIFMVAAALFGTALAGCASSDSAAPTTQSSSSETASSAVAKDEGTADTCEGTMFLEYSADSGEPTRAGAIETMRDTISKTVERGWVENDDETPFDWFVKAEIALTRALEVVDKAERGAREGATVFVAAIDEQGQQIGLVEVGHRPGGYNVDGLELNTLACDAG